MSEVDDKAALAASPEFRALARSLWRETELRGAALMVGAGFSRNAGLPAFNSPKPPLWGDLLRAMRNEMGIDGNAAPGALRLAARYEEMFGRGRLEGLIRRLVPDAGWSPGDMHTRFLRLPWTDVLTTNYDTLLERAADEIVDPAYDIVLTPFDLARTRAPRIVKLHGTLPSHTPFVITEADYREYPSRFAPFVNLVRQVLIENDVCMLGFSGDDPNFTAWTSWVRAEIAPYVRTLFLVGLLDLTGETRDAHLGRGITPIDLSPFVPDRTGDRDERNAAALALFLAALDEARPAAPEAWPPKVSWPATMVLPPDPMDLDQRTIGLEDADFAARYIESCAGRWRGERLAYPGWLEPPPGVRRHLEIDVSDHVRALRGGLGHARVVERTSVLGDVLWRLDLLHGTLHPFDLEWIEPLLQATDPLRLRQEDRALFGRLLVSAHREAEDREGFERWRAWLTPAAARDGEVRALVAFEEALWARDQLDYAAVAAHVDGVSGRDPVWHLRRAMLLADLGKHDAVEESVLQAYRQLRALAARDRRSLWIRSRLAWAAFMAHALTRTDFLHERNPEFVSERLADHDWFRRFEDGACNPWHIVEALDADIRTSEKEVLEDAGGPTSAFEAGRIKPRGTTLRTMPTATVDRFAARLANHVGIPMSLNESVNVFGHRIAKAVGICADTDDTDTRRVLAAASNGDRNLLETRYNRIAVARLDLAVVRELVTRIRRALDHARSVQPSNGFQRSRMERLTEILSRLVIRLPGAEAQTCLRAAMEFARHPDWSSRELHKVLDNLISRSLEAISAADRRASGLDMISFPLPSEAGLRLDMEWPEPSRYIGKGTVRPADDPRWTERIGQLIAATESGEKGDASSATVRLIHLSVNGLLSADERVRFGRAFWGRRASRERDGLRPAVSVYAIFETPAPDEEERRSILRDLILGPEADPVRPTMDGNWLLRRMAEAESAGVRSYLSDDELRRVADAYLRWRLPEPSSEFPDWFGIGRAHEQMGREIAMTLALAVLPTFTPEDLGDSLAGALRILVRESPLPDHAVLVPEAVRLRVLSDEDAADRLQDALLGHERQVVLPALKATSEWALRHHSGTAQPVPRRLVEEIVGLVGLRAARGLPQALQTAKVLVTHDFTTSADARRLEIGLRNLLQETDYGSWSGDDEATARLTLVRADAVRLAAALASKGLASETTERWNAAAASDALPEVRFAVEDAEDVPDT